MGITTELARYLVETGLDGIPVEVQKRAKNHILDTLGVAVAGSTFPQAQITRDYVHEQGGNRRATVLVSGDRASPPMAAFANGVAARAPQFDDTVFMFVHISGCEVPALLALGEELGSTGRDLLEAYIVGFETFARLAQGMLLAQYLRGWHSTGAMGIIGATAACAKLAGLNRRQTAWAFGIASSMSSGMRGNFGTFAMHLHTGSAAKNALMAVQLARRGITGCEEIFEHRFGYGALTAGPENMNQEAVLAALADKDRYFLVDPGIGIKLHPTNSASLVTIQNTLDLVREYDVKPEDVDYAELGHCGVSSDIVGYDDPKDMAEAKISLTHPLAGAIVFRKMGIPEFMDPAVNDPRVKELRAKVKRYILPDYTQITDHHDVPAVKVTLHLKDGRTVSKFRQRPRAYPGGDPLTRETLLEKFFGCVEMALPRQQGEKCLELVDNLEKVARVAELVESLVKA